MSEDSNLFEWKRLAQMDIETARHMFNTYHPKPFEVICFHAQQAAEKMLKCFLVSKDVEVPKTHDMRKLCEMCIQFDASFDEIFEPAVLLTRYGVIPRYPAELNLIIQDSESAIRDAEKVVSFVNNIIGVVFCDIDMVDDSLIKYAVIVARHKGKWVFCKNKNRKWELPGGHREEGETIDNTARRELYEETGAKMFEITPISAYSISNYGILFFSEIEEFGELPESEIETIGFYSDLPNDLSFPRFHPKHFAKVKDTLHTLLAESEDNLIQSR